MDRQKMVKRILAVVTLIFMIPVLCVCITHTQHNIVWYKELVVTTGFLIGIPLVVFLLKKGESFLRKYERVLLGAFLVLITVSLYVISAYSRNTPMYDYYDIYTSAGEYAKGGEAKWGYLSHWSNNFPLFFVLTSIMKGCYLLRLSEPFYILLAINVLLTVWGGVCVYRLLRQTTEYCCWAFSGLGLYFCFLPLWGGTNYFYTDSLSMVFGIWAVYVFLQARNKWVGAVSAGVLWGVGYGFKVTTLICLIALFMVLCMWDFKERLKYFVLTVLVLLSCVLGWEGIRQQYPSYTGEAEYGAPITYWLALGSVGNGSYPDNLEFAVECLETSGKAAKNQLALDYIRENRGDILKPYRLVSKIKYNFASGKMGLSEYNQYPTGFMYELVNDYGRFGGFSTMFTSGYFYALLIFGMAGFGRSVLGAEQQKEDKILMLAHLTVYGLFLFLMIWESNNRQLYNHIPWYALYGSVGLYRLFGGMKGEVKR